MKILVFDDSLIHQEAAKLSLVGHDLVVVGTYDEAQKALTSVVDYDKAKVILPGLLEKAGLPTDFEPHGKNKEASEEVKAKFWALKDESRKLATNHPDFDVVLTDLMVPASGQAQGQEGDRFVGQEMPLGTTIALLALVAGVKKVAVVTDMNHHSHPASAAFDCFGSMDKAGANIICTNRVGMLNIDEATGLSVDGEILQSEEGKKKYPYPEGKSWGDRQGLKRGGKNWGGILKQLLGEEVAS